jgi:hypothetical protein
MPEVCRFLGIIITMYHGDHSPPHFHVRYNQYQALVDIRELRIIQGKLPPRVLGLVMEWATLHHSKLVSNWELASLHKPLEAIDPLA